MLRYLLDSNIVSEPARPRPNTQVQEQYRRHQREAALPSVVWHELVYGARRLPQGRRRDFIEHYLADVVHPSLPILPFDVEAAMWLGQERARLESLGRPRPVVDGMIAATAATRDLILVTRNT